MDEAERLHNESLAIKREVGDYARDLGMTRVALFTDSRYTLGVLTQGWKAKVNTQLIAQRSQLIEIDAHE